MRNKIPVILCVFLPLGLFVACTAMQTAYSPPRVHPEDGGDELKMCSNCHESSSETIVYERFNHDVYFAQNHGQVVRQQAAVCTMCHKQSDCDDCHGVRVELKPSIKNQTDNYRRMPHRGDYLSRHAIDGRINPTSCYRCHGNPERSRTCKPCHG